MILQSLCIPPMVRFPDQSSPTEPPPGHWYMFALFPHNKCLTTDTREPDSESRPQQRSCLVLSSVIGAKKLDLNTAWTD